ncbi:urease accessory protein UreD [Jannaschia pohangensis]|uniref:Urease accessory protein UreD n=1 Tax=Jannaschia pohangensis TaxID=390807 RepID=A0A1I3HMR0_9RHOB|nr:urease accessory protein UreD [Jannaschia pohangensis]SFI36971.1 urease accessory protein [Jannaschia pohangensis]
MLDRPRMQRITGEAQVVLGRAGLVDLRQAGSAKAMLPRTDADVPEVVFLNTAGGVTSGDRLDYALTLRAGARATGATQTAERAYRADDGPGRIETVLRVGAGGHLDWLPQEVIAFDGSDMVRRTSVDLTGDATFLGVDSVILGRAAHGEVVATARLDDHRQVRRDGRLIHDERLVLGPGVFGGNGPLGTARAFATLVLVSPGAADALAPLRDVLPKDEAVEAAASAWDGRLVVRMLAAEAAPLRRALIRAIVTLRGTPVPRVWQSDV